MSPNVNATVGALFLGHFAAAIFYGINCVQTYGYFQLFDKDHWTLKFAVFSLWMLGTLHMAVVSHAVYTYIVSGFGNIETPSLTAWSIWSQAIISPIITILVRLIYGIRIWRLSNRNLYLVSAIALSALFSCGCGIAATLQGLQLNSFDIFSMKTYLLYLSLGSSIVTDTVITSSLCVLLFSNRTHIKRINSLLNTLMLYTIYTGMLTGVYALVLTVFYAFFRKHATSSKNSLLVAFYFPSPNMYLNALLANLNARYKLREEYYNGNPITFDTPLETPRAVVKQNVATNTHTPEWVIDIRNH